MNTKEIREATPLETILINAEDASLNIGQTAKLIEEHFESKSKKEAEKIEKIISATEDEHPYKEAGNPDSYSSYNEGWTDACDILGERILTIFEKRGVMDERCNE